MKKQTFFTLGRIIDRSYFTNKLIIIFTLIAIIIGIIFNFFKTNDIQDSIYFGFILALFTFLTWVAAREIYPQGEYADLVASVFIIFSIFWFELFPSTIFLLLWLTLSLRLLNQTTGLEPSYIDRMLVFIFSIIVAIIFSWIFFIIMAVVFIINYLHTKNKNDIIMATFALISTFIYNILRPLDYNQSPFVFDNVFFIGLILIVFLIMMWLVRNVKVICDHANKIAQVTRIFSAQIITVVFCAGYILWFGKDGILELVPIWVILLCGIIFSPYQIIKKL